MKEKIFAELTRLAHGIPGLASLSVVGSHADIQKPLEKTNDFDILVVVRELSAEVFLDIQGKVENLALLLKTDQVLVWPEYRIGAIKATYTGSEPMGVMLHMLIFDLESFASYQIDAPFITLDWSKYPALYGQELIELFQFNFPTVDQLFHAPRHSTDYYEKMLADKAYTIIDVTVEEGEVRYTRTTAPYSEDQIPELCADFLKKIILNTLMVLLQQNRAWDEAEMLEAFYSSLPQCRELDLEIREVLALKKRARSGEHLSPSNVRYEAVVRQVVAAIKRGLEHS